MMDNPAASPASETIEFRVRPASRDLIDRAAEASGMDRGDFVASAVRREAEAVLMDRRLFALDGDAFDAFQAVLDSPPEENAAASRLLEMRPPWTD